MKHSDVSRVAAVVLAAGSSRRMSMGRGDELNKLLCRIDGVSLLHRTCRTVLATQGIARTVVVLGHQSELLEQELEGLQLKSLLNPNHLEGQGSSVRLATEVLAQADTALEGLLFVPADQPGLDTTTIRKLLDRFAAEQARGAAPIVAPRCESRPGAPVVFPRRLFGQLKELTGDEGGRQLLRQDEQAIAWVELTSSLPLEDADTREAFLDLCGQLGATPDLMEAAS